MGLIFSDRADAKAAKFVGVLTAAYGLVAMNSESWGILSGATLIVAGIVLFRHNAQTVNGIRGILRNILFFVLLIIAAGLGPASP
ncbi:hypothetical protein [Haladaptatus halobius]|uniref:hypothetical protein n=1 Tax=Haladaptatus halobius TaxID=2884875 RepID=UPI001D0A9663|nr:hypothetical protein [Haladaptatus halobius]